MNNDTNMNNVAIVTNNTQNNNVAIVTNETQNKNIAIITNNTNMNNESPIINNTQMNDESSVINNTHMNNDSNMLLKLTNVPADAHFKSNWLQKDINMDLFKNNILVKFSHINHKNNVLSLNINTYLVVSTVYLNITYKIDVRNKRLVNNLHNIHQGKILYVSVNCDNIDSTFLNPDYKKLNSNILDKIKNTDSSNLSYLNVTINDLLSIDIGNDNDQPNILKILKDSSFNNYDVIFLFEKAIWYKILFSFAKKSIYISGGNTSKRHLLTSSQALLSIFLASFDPSYLTTIRESFSNDINLKLAKKNLLDSNLITSLNKKSASDPVLINAVINYSYYLEMYQYLGTGLYEYINLHSDFIGKFID